MINSTLRLFKNVFDAELFGEGAIACCNGDVFLRKEFMGLNYLKKKTI